METEEEEEEERFFEGTFKTLIKNWQDSKETTTSSCTIGYQRRYSTYRKIKLEGPLKLLKTARNCDLTA